MRMETLRGVRTSIGESRVAQAISNARHSEAAKKIWTGIKLSTIALGPLTYTVLHEIANVSRDVAALGGIVAAVVISVPVVFDATVEDMEKSGLLSSGLPTHL